mmetsp:Transcript_31109/g.64908  ORF Transcript_31109/g.64908 Transcript_31109/m.64908 type:complete len:131 (-) Transcript_31109:522-914(-)
MREEVQSAQTKPIPSQSTLTQSISVFWHCSSGLRSISDTIPSLLRATPLHATKPGPDIFSSQKTHALSHPWSPAPAILLSVMKPLKSVVKQVDRQFFPVLIISSVQHIVQSRVKPIFFCKQSVTSSFVPK